jgi:ABC-2 type transport system ATP-binding protein
MEVKKRIGYLPETPPLYPEMEVEEYLTFVGKLKGMSGPSLATRVGEVSERCAIADVRKKLISKLSKGYRQRVGLAQAIIHNPDVLILDEPTAGLDPKQIIETRDLIHSLAGAHTIILSTHILPEVEHICQQVIIINKGKVVATDSVENLQNRARGAESVVLEIEGRDGDLDAKLIQQRLEMVSGVSRVVFKESRASRSLFEVESLKDRFIRGDLARAVVEAGWNLNELRPSAMSLEEIFLQLTGAEKTEPAAPAVEEDATPVAPTPVAQGESK